MENTENKNEINIKLKNELAIQFRSLRSMVTKNLGKPASNIEVMISLFRALLQRQAIESKIISIRKQQEQEIEELKTLHKQEIAELQHKLDDFGVNTFELLRESINKPQVQPNIIIQAGALAQNTTQQQYTPSLVPPPKPPMIEGLQKLPNDVLDEINAKFRPENFIDGQLKPSLMSKQEWEIPTPIEEKEEKKELTITLNDPKDENQTWNGTKPMMYCNEEKTNECTLIHKDYFISIISKINETAKYLF